MDQAVPRIEPAKGTRKWSFQRSRYKHLKDMNVLRSLVVAKSGSGKTVLLQQLILSVLRSIGPAVVAHSESESAPNLGK